MEVVEKEGNYVTAKVRANIWAYTYRNLSGWFEAITHSPLQPGIKILFKAAVNFHEVYGFSLTIKDIDPNFTLGERARKRKEVVDKLVKDGVYDMNKNLALPLVPQRIAIISSATAAGYGDFLDQLNNNPKGYAFETTLFQALMQGDQASQSMTDALLRIHESIADFDLVVLIRGGGAQVDLDCFDQYELAAHIAQFPLPVITGIGHERDETIADLVAHTKMKTPTAVAEFLVSGLEKIDEQLNESIYRIERAALHLMQLETFRLQAVSNKLQISAKGQFNYAKETISHLKLSLRFSSAETIRMNELKLDRLKVPLVRSTKHRLGNMRSSLVSLQKELALVDPKAVLKRGYSITRVNGKLIGTQPLKPDDQMETVTEERIVKSKITEIK